MKTYTPRERVKACFRHEEADRIPVDLMGNASMLLDDTYLKLRDHLKLDPIPPVRSGSTANYYDERILDILDIDFRRIFLPKHPDNKQIQNDDGSFSDIWGIKYKKIGRLVNIIHNPLAEAMAVDQIESYPWPDPVKMFHTDGIADKAREFYETTDHVLVARNPTTGGFLEHSCNLMGMQEFLMALVAYPDLAEALIQQLLKIFKGVYGIFLDAVGPYVQMVEVSDDLGSQENLIISPEIYRKFIKPAQKELYQMIHVKAPNAAVFHHTDGAVFDIIPDLIEVGVNVLNPVQTSSKGMEASKIKNEYGKDIIFHGTIESINNRGTKSEVIDEVKSRIDSMAPGGGLVIAPCNHMMDVDPETILAMYDTAKSYGQY
jgi:uroporphyrinogen decarboxylase